MDARHYRSLADFLIANPLTVDASLDDGWGEPFPLKGREIEAAILFADITGFSHRTEEFTPIETLLFLNNFLAWVTAEGLRNPGGIVDKYVGDEVMVVFSTEFGSEDPIRDAFRAAVAMAEFDALSFCPHFGLAAGRVVVGYTGSTAAYSASVFGTAVTLAARCVGYKGHEPRASTAITFPEEIWPDCPIEELVSSRGCANSWQLGEPRSFAPRNMRTLAVRQLFKTAVWIPQMSADQRALLAYQKLWEAGEIQGGSPPSEVEARVGWVDAKNDPRSGATGCE